MKMVILTGIPYYESVILTDTTQKNVKLDFSTS